MSSLRVILPFGCLSLVAAGCATTDPLTAWRGAVTRYVTQQGHGDPGVLAELTDSNARNSLRPARRTIGQWGVASRGPNRASRVRDVQGVLLGARTFEGRRWFVFLVGVTPRVRNAPMESEDVRPAACAAERDGLLWLMGPADPEALRSYLRGAERAASGGPSAAFPREWDDFVVDMEGGEVSVREKGSGAVWRMKLPSTP